MTSPGQKSNVEMNFASTEELRIDGRDEKTNTLTFQSIKIHKIYDISVHKPL